MLKLILVTGATGFVGRALVNSLLLNGQSVVALVRHLDNTKLPQNANLQWKTVDSIDNQTLWQPILQGVNTIVHCAARTHAMKECESDVLEAYTAVNVIGTLNLARQAAAGGVERFVFISSIKVNGDISFSGKPFTEESSFLSLDSYGRSKAEAEQALLNLATQSGMEVVIIRPPLVYGPGVKGNFAAMVKVVQRGIPLPLGAVHNQRSLLALDNLVSLLLLCADLTLSPKAANQVFVVADGEDVSTTSLLRKVAQAAGKPSRLLPVPSVLLRAWFRLLGKRAVADRLLGNLQVDATKARTLLGWRPVVTMDEQLTSMFATPASYSRPLLRVLDIVFSATGLLVLWPVLLLVCVVVWFDTRSPLFTQKRVGRYQQPFVLVKFRTMSPGTAHVASHMASSESITRLGAMLRRTKLDELPQLWNVLMGHMSLVGPRPGLFNQHDLTQARTAHCVYAARPGITGLAQVSGIDMSTPELLAQTDARMLREMSVRNYFKLIFLTVLGKGSGDGVKTQ